MTDAIEDWQDECTLADKRLYGSDGAFKIWSFTCKYDNLRLEAGGRMLERND
jgi:hypothetical protein